jgi:AraC-like DNA-binding protein
MLKEFLMITATNVAQSTSSFNAYNAEKALDSGYQNLDRIRGQARIPVMHGTAGQVLVTLQNRIGCDSLGIKYIAEHMGMSKRTLQRRLKAQMVHYAGLRDRVRFNRAINCLLVEKMSIEATSGYLDFSDRTSFTNAFKRWSDLSPSTFRKLYRDYV